MSACNTKCIVNRILVSRLKKSINISAASTILSKRKRLAEENTKCPYNFLDFGDGNSGVQDWLPGVPDGRVRENIMVVRSTSRIYTIILPRSDLNRNRVSHLHGPIGLKLNLLCQLLTRHKLRACCVKCVLDSISQLRETTVLNLISM